MNCEVYLRTRRLDLDLEPPFLFFLDAADAGAAGPADAGAADAGAAGAADSGTRFLPLAGATADAATGAADAPSADAPSDDSTGSADASGATNAAVARLPLSGAVGTPDAFASSAAFFLSAVACLASSFFRSRLASSATFLAAASFTRVASATSAANFFVRSFS